MSRSHQRSPTHSIYSLYSQVHGSTLSWDSSKFTDRLSISVPPPDRTFERSKFSPDSPTMHLIPFDGHLSRRTSPRSQVFDPEKGTASVPSSQQPRVRDRLTRLLAIPRVSRRNDPSVQRIASSIVAPRSEAPVWGLDNSRESDSQPRYVHPPPTRTQERYSPALLIAFAIFLLLLFINVIILNVRSFSSSLSRSSLGPIPATVTAPHANLSTNAVTISAGAQQCLTEYMLNAPSNPRGYPCSTCLPDLIAVPTNASQIFPVARDATEFCALRSIWEDAGQKGQAGLEAGGWVKDARFCAWSGVRCNGVGRVSSLQLTFPAVPASVPAQFTNLTELESLEIVGGGNTPAGQFPTNFGALTKLTALHLENTSLGALPDTLENLTSLILVRNAQLGSSLPPSIGGSALQSLIVNSEPLTLSAAQNATLCSRHLQNCDLRGTGIKTCGACSVN